MESKAVNKIETRFVVVHANFASITGIIGIYKTEEKAIGIAEKNVCYYRVGDITND